MGFSFFKGVNNMIHIMTDEHMNKLREIDFIPYVQVAFALIDKPRKCGGNALRHSMNTFNILIDYGYCDPIILKAAIVHDVLEDYDDFDENLILRLENGKDVLSLVKEVSRIKGESKPNFLNRIKNKGSNESKIIKVADRIDNITSLGQVNNMSFVVKYIKETEKFVYPIAEEINKYMLQELQDMIFARRKILHKFIGE